MLSLLHLPSISIFQTMWLDVTGALLFPQLCNGPWCECTLADSRPCQWMSVSGCTQGIGAHGAFCSRTCECPPLLDDTKLFEVRLCPFYSCLDVFTDAWNQRTSSLLLWQLQNGICVFHWQRWGPFKVHGQRGGGVGTQVFMSTRKTCIWKDIWPMPGVSGGNP